MTQPDRRWRPGIRPGRQGPGGRQGAGGRRGEGSAWTQGGTTNPVADVGIPANHVASGRALARMVERAAAMKRRLLAGVLLGATGCFLLFGARRTYGYLAHPEPDLGPTATAEALSFSPGPGAKLHVQASQDPSRRVRDGPEVLKNR